MRIRPLLFATLAVVAAVGIPSANAQELRIGSPIADSLDAEAEHEYSLALDADRFVYGYVDQISVDAVVRILDEDGEAVRSFDSPARGPESFHLVTDKAGTYTIQVSPFEREEGRYEIVLVSNEPKASTPEAFVDQLMRPFTGRDRPGAVVSVLRHGEVVLARGYGMANLTYGVPMTENTGMSIASISKQFTGMAILLLEQDGKLSLDDDIRKHIPELKDFGTPVTLRHMLNHTSGYREVLNFLPIAGWNSTDAMTRDVPIRIIQRQPNLQNVPGAEYNYNNTTFMLLATVVERVSGMGYTGFMEGRIFRPLGMNDTTIKTHQGQVIPNSSQGYANAREGGYRYVTDFASAYGASGIISTARDMAKWMLNYRDATVGGHEAIEALTTPAVLAGGDTTGYGLGIGIGEWRGQTLYGHGGGETSHESYFAYFPDIESGVFVSGSHPAFSREVWSDVAEAYFGDELEPAESEDEEVEASADVSAPTAEQLEAIAGRYIAEREGLVIDVTVEDGHLFAQVPNRTKRSLTPTSDSTFDFVDLPAAMTFHYEADNSVNRATRHHTRDVRLDRVDAAVLNGDQLEAFAGRYYNAELETIYTLKLEDGTLKAFHARNEPFTVRHVVDDEFNGGAWYLRQIKFDRDPTGAISGFMASNGRTRGVWFQKMEP